MAYEETQPELAPPQLEAARSYLRSFLARFAKEAGTTGRELAVEALCTGLEAIPVPVLNVALARTVRRMLTGSPGRASVDVEEVLEILAGMQESNEDFERGLERLGLDLAEIASDVRAIREEMADQRRSRLQLINVKTELRWPVFDNRLSALLANTGGGSVVVDELVVHVESWEPEPTVDYSVPAAPLDVLYLQAELATSRADYPLFELNGVEPRIFNERGAGADRIVLDLSSPENVRYALRLQVPFTDLVAGAAGTVVWPPPQEPPLVLPFVCGPGWREIEIEKLHAPETIYEDLKEKLSGLARALGERSAEGAYDAGFEESLERLGIPSYVVGGWIFRGFLHRFVPLFGRLAPGEDRPRALGIVAGLLAAAPAESLAELPGDDTLAGAVADLALGTPLEHVGIEFASRLGDPEARARLSHELTSG